MWRWIQDKLQSQGLPDPRTGTPVAQMKLCKGLLGHSCYLLDKQELWIQEDLQIAYHLWIGKCKDGISPGLTDPDIRSILVGLSWRWFLLIHICTRLSTNIGLWQLAGLELKNKIGYHHYADINPQTSGWWQASCKHWVEEEKLQNLVASLKKWPREWLLHSNQHLLGWEPLENGAPYSQCQSRRTPLSRVSKATSDQRAQG